MFGHYLVVDGADGMLQLSRSLGETALLKGIQTFLSLSLSFSLFLSFSIIHLPLVNSSKQSFHCSLQFIVSLSMEFLHLN